MEKPPSENSEIYDVKTLSPQTKMRMLLEIFDLGKDKEKNEERKKKFIELLSTHYRASILSKPFESNSNITYVEDSDKNKKGIHDEIMEIIRNISLSLGLTEDQKKLSEYLANNREEVGLMIRSYFSTHDPVNIKSDEYLRTKEQLNTLSSQTGPEEE